MANYTALQIASICSGISDSKVLSEVLDLIPDGVLGFDLQSRYILWNSAMERISGIPRTQVLGRVAYDVFPFLREIGEDHQFAAVLRGESIHSSGRRFRIDSSGRDGLFDGDYRPLCDDRGKVVGGIGIIRDRTDDETAFLETLLRTGEVVSGDLDLQRIVQSVTDAATQATGAQFGAFFYNVINQKGESYTLYTLSGVPREAFSKFPMPRNTDVFAPTFNGEGIVRSDDITADPRYGKNVPHHGMPEGHLPVRSYLAVPVKSRSGEVLGGLFFGHSKPAVFLPSSERLVGAMAKQAAIAIENARLYEQQRLARQAAEESELRVHTIWSSISDAFVFFDRDWRYTYVNQKACELAGRTREELLGTQIWDLYPAEANGPLRVRLDEALSMGRASHFEIFFNPWQRWIECHCYPSAEGIGLYFRDITSRREAEQALSKAEDRLRLVTDSTEIGLWYCDLPFDKLDWSDKTKEHFWLTPDAEVTIDVFFDRLHPDDRERTRNAIQRSIDHRAGYDIDYRTMSVDGRIKWIRAIGRAFYDANNNPIRFDGITVDTTERKVAEDALRRSEKLAAAGRLSATIAHEINNPLAAVTNLLFLSRNSEDIAEVRSFLKVADQELQRVAHIAKQTLGFYKDSAAPSELNLAEVVEQVLSIYTRRLDTRNIHIRTDFRTPNARMIGNSGELRQVISNLIANAIDATPDGGRIVLRVSAKGERIRVSVSDNGSGIPTHARKRIFEPFHTTKTDVGTGLGLWVSRQLIQKHGGLIRFRTCTTEGRSGTTFSFTVPVAAA